RRSRCALGAPLRTQCTKRSSPYTRADFVTVRTRSISGNRQPLRDTALLCNVSLSHAARLAAFPDLRTDGTGHPDVDDRHVLRVRAAPGPPHPRPDAPLRIRRLPGPDAGPA